MAIPAVNPVTPGLAVASTKPDSPTTGKRVAGAKIQGSQAWIAAGELSDPKHKGRIWGKWIGAVNPALAKAVV